MKIGLYSRLAWNNIKKNAKLYIPNILSGIGLTVVFYIILTLSKDERLSEVRGGSYLPTIMSLGVIVIALLSFILVLYTNSFLMKQRNQEFGLYNVLGMEKRHIGKILFWHGGDAVFLSEEYEYTRREPPGGRGNVRKLPLPFCLYTADGLNGHRTRVVFCGKMC